MIYGIGIDIVKIQRMKDASEKWGRKFFEKILSDNEISYCYERSDPYPSLAVRFAAKEALIKAIGAEIAFSMKDVEVVNNEKGRPTILAKGKLEEFLRDKAIKHCHLSLSHEKEFGVACVVLES
ncbi:MAG: holo-ACP synthase [Nitrospirae bacterium]|nr:holo-ACP synthase [Nitrospirota bacterium]